MSNSRPLISRGLPAALLAALFLLPTAAAAHQGPALWQRLLTAVADAWSQAIGRPSPDLDSGGVSYGGNGGTKDRPPVGTPERFTFDLDPGGVSYVGDGGTMDRPPIDPPHPFPYGLEPGG